MIILLICFLLWKTTLVSLFTFTYFISLSKSQEAVPGCTAASLILLNLDMFILIPHLLGYLLNFCTHEFITIFLMSIFSQDVKLSVYKFWEFTVRKTWQCVSVNIYNCSYWTFFIFTLMKEVLNSKNVLLVKYGFVYLY